MTKYLGIDVGGGSIRGSVIDEQGNLYLDLSVKTNPESSNEELIDSIGKLIDQAEEKETFDAIGIGTPGPINIDEGIIYASANLKNLKNTPLIQGLKSKTNLPIHFNNDSNCASLGEYYFGDNSRVERLFVFTLGTGLGGGFIYQGKLYNGLQGNGMEVGHITVIPKGAKCGCGQLGCAESYFSTSGFLARYKDKTNKTLSDAKAFFDLIRAGDEDCKEILELGVEAFSDCIRSVVHLLNPQKIVFLGGISQSYDLFGKSLEEKLGQKIFPVLAQTINYSVGKKLAGSFGAASLCF